MMIFDTTTCKISNKRAEIGLTVSEKYFHALVLPILSY